LLLAGAVYLSARVPVNVTSSNKGLSSEQEKIAEVKNASDVIKETHTFLQLPSALAIYALMVYMAQCVMFSMRAAPFVRFVTILFLVSLLRSRKETEGEGGSSRGAAT
jgi:hypothetical protein